MKLKLRIIHETKYLFNGGVTIEPHYLRFMPCDTPYNLLESFDLIISPTPAGISQQSDAENNMVHLSWFEGIYHELNIRSEAVLITQINNPLDFILFPTGFSDLPFNYPRRLENILSASLKGESIGNPLIDYGNNILLRSSYQTINFLIDLTAQISNDFTAESRQEGEPYMADTTFYLEKGSCRDLAWMQIQLLRHMGIAAKFVSGYYYADIDASSFELHAWVVVYLPGAGWIGFDPSNGVMAGSNHIPICTSAQYENTMPVTGSFSGPVGTTLQTNLLIESLPFDFQYLN